MMYGDVLKRFAAARRSRGRATGAHQKTREQLGCVIRNVRSRAVRCSAATGFAARFRPRRLRKDLRGFDDAARWRIEMT